MPRSYANRKPIIVYVDNEDYRKIAAMAKERRLSLSAMARVLLAYQLAHGRPPRDGP